MRSVLFAAAICALILAACSGTPQPTATPIPPTDEPTTNPVAVGDTVLATMAATVGAPSAGTLVVPDEQRTPNAPTPVPVVIDDLYFAQAGGIAGITQTIQLFGDGKLIRDGETSTVSADDVQQIASLLDQIHFYELQGTFTGPGSPADAYRYSLTVNSPNGSRTIASVDGMTPPELYLVYDAIRSLGTGS